MRRRLLLNKQETIPEVVSGTANGFDWIEIDGVKWARQTVGTKLNNSEHFYCSWGETIPVASYTGKTLYKNNVAYSGVTLDAYKYSSGNTITKYNSKDKKTTLDIDDDAASAIMGNHWRLPTTSQFSSLLNNKNLEREIKINTSRNERYVRFKHKLNPNIYIDFYFEGRIFNSTPNITSASTVGYYLTRNSSSTSDTLCNIAIISTSTTSTYTTTKSKYQACSVIGVYEPYSINTEYIDLGLPSGTLWAKYNIGAHSFNSYGIFGQYGFGDKTYFALSENYSKAELAESADTATQLMGSPWHLPTRTQCRELINNTSFFVDYDEYGLAYGTFKSKINNNVLKVPLTGFIIPHINDGTQIYGTFSKNIGNDFALCTKEAYDYLYNNTHMFFTYYMYQENNSASTKVSYYTSTEYNRTFQIIGTPMRGVRT